MIKRELLGTAESAVYDQLRNRHFDISADELQLLIDQAVKNQLWIKAGLLMDFMSEKFSVVHKPKALGPTNL